MGNHSMARFFKNAELFVSKHSPEILTGFGIAGMITTTILAVKATPKALRLIEEKQNELHPDSTEKLPIAEVVKVAWKPYIPAVVTGVTSVACLIGATSVSVRRNAALATAYKLSETALTEYREKVVETIGEKKEQAVRDRVAEEQIKKNPVSKNEVVITGTGETRFFDPMSGRHFYSTVEKIKRAENELNKQMLHSIYGYASLNDFYDEINLPHVAVGDSIGWNTTHLIDMDISAQVDDDGMPSIVLEYLHRPEYDYDK